MKATPLQTSLCCCWHLLVAATSNTVIKNHKIALHLLCLPTPIPHLHHPGPKPDAIPRGQLSGCALLQLRSPILFFSTTLPSFLPPALPLWKDTNYRHGWVDYRSEVQWKWDEEKSGAVGWRRGGQQVVSSDECNSLFTVIVHWCSAPHLSPLRRCSHTFSSVPSITGSFN